jgi:radical SAM-linked protein
MTEAISIKYSAIYSKKGESIFISHLDIMSLFRRAMRRASLPFVLTKGFTPRVRISIPQALKLGRESSREEMSFWLAEEVTPELLVDQINKELPDGVRILEIEKV